MKFVPHEYQQYAINKILELPTVGLFLDMGLGKTVIALTAVDELMFDRFEVQRVLIIAPKRVAEDTWSRESQKWDHLNHLKISKIIGDQKQRIAAINARADIYVVNRENVVWLTEQFRSWPFDMVVIDELSSFKSSKAKRFKALKKMTPLIHRMIGLTGTPTPNGLLDLWPQMYLLDRGERLGKTLGGYRERYFSPGRRNGYTVFDWDPKEGAEEAIHKKISDICISMSAKDYLTLPERISNIVPVHLDPLQSEKYREFEKTQIVELMKDEVIVAPAAAAVTNKLLQMANGSVYNEDGKTVPFHDKKLDALEDIIEFNQEPILVFYNYKHDFQRLTDRFSKLNPRTLETSRDIADWNSGKIRLLLAHPASVGHGLNIQAGGHIIVWFGLTWSLELYQQANARLDRQGQTKNVIIHHLVAEGTVDEDVMKALERKDRGQAALMDALMARMEEYRK